MGRSQSLLLALALLATAALPAAAHAQGTTPVHLGLGAGVVTPSGSTTELDPGYRIQAALQFNVPLSPLAIRAEGFYMRLPLKGAAGPGKDRLTGAEGNVLLQVPLLPGFPLVPYLMGGAGLYGYQRQVDNAINEPSKTYFGLDVGAGAMLHIGHTRVSLDARYERINGAPDLVPVTAMFWF